MPLRDKAKKGMSNHFEELFRHATMGILITDGRGNITAINPFALKEFGYSQKELIGKSINKLIPSHYHKAHNHHHKKYFKKPQNRPMGAGMNLPAIKKNGKEFPVEINLSFYKSGGEKFVIAFINNISERKKAEADINKLTGELEQKVEKRTGQFKKAMHELEITNDLLEDAVSFQKAIVDNAGAMIIATDEKGVIKLFNPEASLNTGYRPQDLINKETPVIFHTKDEILGKQKELLREFGVSIKTDFDVLVEKARRNIHEEEQYTYIRKNGTSFPVLLSITSIKNNDGEITGFMGIAVDISERKKMEEELKQSLEKEKELSELKTRFVSMASHEFRTPLSTVLSSAYLIEKYSSTEDQPKRDIHLQRIVSSVNTLTDILNDFLSLGKIEEGKIQVRPSTFNIKQLVADTAGEMKNNLKKEQLIRYYHKGIPEVEMDATLLKHIIMNLVSNASKFSREKTAIEISTKNLKHQFTLSVKDQGMGISREDQKHLMERFFRGANAGNIQGTGLGLHIVSKYAELMNGTVECKSELEKGTEFVITFTKKAG
jgi:PAS domain S-box-containing protein